MLLPISGAAAVEHGVYCLEGALYDASQGEAACRWLLHRQAEPKPAIADVTEPGGEAGTMKLVANGVVQPNIRKPRIRFDSVV